MVTVASQACGPRPGGPGPARGQPWATARPEGSVRVMHHRVAGLAARVPARSRQVSASVGPMPGMSPGLSVRPSQAVAGMVRCTVPPSLGPVSPGQGAVVPPGAGPTGTGWAGAGVAGARRAGGAGCAGRRGAGGGIAVAGRPVGTAGDEAVEGFVGEQGG